MTKAQGSLKKIINNISRLQDEKQKLLTKYENAMDEIVRMKNDAQLKEEIESKQYATIYNTRQVMVCHYHVVFNMINITYRGPLRWYKKWLS